ncbi:hypothetical protein [Streptomyces bambusae]|uniref:Transposase n=1 Tax=Streptomyces bambusae TaxID=1550616 RepID=A0ABS6YZG1_9ACTN|nr:hypothetical protein [Streptomyces bambusae]MBW5480870.1 hypothetical protein [Streptomyces bambusae]
MGQSDEQRSVSDEEWAAFMRRAEQGAGAAPEEPSARARMVTERLRREDEERAGAQKKRFGRKGKPVRNEPEGWRTGPAWQEMEGRRKPGPVRIALILLLIAGLALIAMRPELLIDRITGKAEGAAKGRQPLPAETVRPSAAPDDMYPDRGTLKEPFRGSPAVQWADGAAGIELPEAKAVNGVSQEQIAAHLGRAKEFLVAANLDPATLRGERPERALKLLDPLDKETKDLAEKSLARPTATDDPLMMFTRFKPSEVQPAGPVVKVRGHMELKPGEAQGQAEVVADYTFVYPVVRPGGSGVERTIVRRQLTFSVVDTRRWQSTAGTLWVRQFQHEIANSSCDTSDGFLHPEFPGSAPATNGPTPSGPPVDPYDRSKSLDQNGQEGCGVVSRT